MDQGTATGDVQLENDRFRVTKWTIGPGQVIPMHRHDHDYVVVPLVNRSMNVRNADGSETVSQLVLGETYSRPAGTEHEVHNPDPTEDVVFVEVEHLHIT